MIFFAAISISSHLLAVAADGAPILNVEPSCRAADTSLRGRDSNACMGDERAAHEQLAKQWAEFSRADRSYCLQLMSSGGAASYVELLSCLEMSRDAKRMAKGQPLSQAPHTTGIGTDRPSVGPPRNRMQPRRSQ